MGFSIAVAYTKNDGGIGKDGRIPWYLPPDLKYFQRLTTQTSDRSKQNAVIMGRNTWLSLPKRPLQGRRNIVLTTGKNIEGIIADGGEVYRSLDDALTHLGNDNTIEKIFVIGGERLYNVAIDHPMCRHIYATVLELGEGVGEGKGKGNAGECDTFFPVEKINSAGFIMTGRTSGMLYKSISYSYITYTRPRA